ncbi:MAG: DUF427 domain-containing protein [Chloroflexota bacterium]
MPRVLFNGQVIAESEKTIVIEGNHYFPPSALKSEHFTPNTQHTVCPWKGVASYFDVSAGGERVVSAAWVYSEPSRAAMRIKDHVAFYRHKVDVQV